MAAKLLQLLEIKYILYRILLNNQHFLWAQKYISYKKYLYMNLYFVEKSLARYISIFYKDKIMHTTYI